LQCTLRRNPHANASVCQGLFQKRILGLCSYAPCICSYAPSNSINRSGRRRALHPHQPFVTTFGRSDLKAPKGRGTWDKPALLEKDLVIDITGQDGPALLGRDDALRRRGEDRRTVHRRTCWQGQPELCVRRYAAGLKIPLATKPQDRSGRSTCPVWIRSAYHYPPMHMAERYCDRLPHFGAVVISRCRRGDQPLADSSVLGWATARRFVRWRLDQRL